MSKIISVDVDSSVNADTTKPLGSVVKRLGISRPGNKGGKPDVEMAATIVFDVTMAQLLEIASRPVVIRYQDNVRRGDANAPDWDLDEVTLYASALAERESILSKKDRTKRDLASLPVAERLAILKSLLPEDAFIVACEKAGVDPESIA